MLQIFLNFKIVRIGEKCEVKCWEIEKEQETYT